MAATKPIIEMTIADEEITFQGTEIIDARVVKEINPISTEVPISTIEFTIYTTDPRFSIFSDGEYYQALSKRQPIRAYEEIAGIKIFVGDFYLDEWESLNEHEFRFTGIDLIGVLDSVDYEGGFWSELTPIQTILGAVLDQNYIRHVIDSDLAGITLKGWIPPGTAREATQQICYAAGATSTTRPGNELAFSAAKLPIRSRNADRSISSDSIEDNQKVSLKPMVSSIELISHDYRQGTESQVIYEEDLEPGDYKIIFNEPYFDVSATGVGYIPYYLATENEDELITESGDSLVIQGDYIYGPNSLKLTVFPPGGSVVVTGYPWIDSKQAHIYQAQEGAAQESRNNLKITDATLVNSSNAQTILELTRDYFTQRYIHELTLMNYQTPLSLYGASPTYSLGLYSQAGLLPNDSIKSTALKTKDIIGIIEQMVIGMTDGFLPKTRVVGIEDLTAAPQQTKEPNGN